MDKSKKSKEEKPTEEQIKQNVYDFNPSQFVEENDVDKKKKEKKDKLNKPQSSDEKEEQ